MAKRKPLSKLVMIRMDEIENAELSSVATAARMTKSEIIRLAVRTGLPSVRRSLSKLQAS